MRTLMSLLTKSGSEKRKSSSVNKENDNLDPYIIPCQKKKKVGKKMHNLSKHVM
ncbi:5265_t:CDS:2, partial [Racocetra fulgida]